MGTVVEMNVVAMLAVALGGQHRAEALAGGAGDVVEEGRFGTATAPIARHQHQRAALELDAGDVDGAAAGVLTPAAVAAILAPAGICPEMADSADTFAKASERGGLDHRAGEILELSSKSAAHHA